MCSSSSFIEEIKNDSDYGKDRIEIPFGSNKSAFITDEKKVEYNTYNLERMYFEDIKDFSAWYFDDSKEVSFGYQVYLGERNGDGEIEYHEGEPEGIKINEEDEGSEVWSVIVYITEDKRSGTAMFPRIKTGEENV